MRNTIDFCCLEYTLKSQGDLSIRLNMGSSIGSKKTAITEYLGNKKPAIISRFIKSL